MIISIVPAFAESDVTVSIPPGSSVPGCEETNECFSPYEVTIDVGDTVTWSNDDSAAHTVTSGTPVDGPDGNFDSSLLMAGSTFSVTFDESGEYPYFCMVHPWQIGWIIVENNSQPNYDHVVINEVDINPPGDDSASISEWVELYNPTDSEINLGGWEIASTTVLKKTMTIIAGTIIQPGEFLTYTYQNVWFTDSNESVELRDENGIVIDKTPLLSDLANDFTSWQRIYDGYDSDSSSDWKFVVSTAGSSNGKLEIPEPTYPLKILDSQIVNAFGSPVDTIYSNVQVQVSTEVKNITSEDFEYYYLLSIVDENDKEIHRLASTGTITDNETFSPSIGWIPTSGEYIITVQFLSELDTSSEEELSLPFSYTVNVEGTSEEELEYTLSDKAIKMFEKKIENWNKTIDRLEMKVDKLESNGKLDKADELRAKILIFESMSEHLEYLIYK